MHDLTALIQWIITFALTGDFVRFIGVLMILWLLLLPLMLLPPVVCFTIDRSKTTENRVG